MLAVTSLCQNVTAKLPTSNLQIYIYTGYTQKNGAVSKVNKKLFLTLHGHNVHHLQRQLSKFLMRYQQFASYAYRGAISKMASQQEKAFCVLRFEVSRSVITAQQYNCSARFRKDAPCMVLVHPNYSHEYNLLTYYMEQSPS